MNDRERHRRVMGRLDAVKETDPDVKFALHLAIGVDEYLVEVLENPRTADAELRKGGYTGLADRLVELFGPAWWD